MTTKKDKIKAWFLFDCEDSSNQKAAANFDLIDGVSIGISRTNKDSKDFVNVNLADFSELFDGKSIVQKIYSKVGFWPTLVCGSSPCEVFSFCTSVKNEYGGKGNAYFQCTPHKMSKNITYSLQDPQAKLYGGGKPSKDMMAFYKRVNGEICWRNLWYIIKEVKPQFWLVEQPNNMAIEYARKFIDLPKPLYAKKVYYSAYNAQKYSPKCEIIFSNIDLKLKNEKLCKVGNAIYSAQDSRKTRSKDYGTKSSIPEELLNDCFEQFIKVWEQS